MYYVLFSYRGHETGVGPDEAQAVQEQLYALMLDEASEAGRVGLQIEHALKQDGSGHRVLLDDEKARYVRQALERVALHVPALRTSPQLLALSALLTAGL
jgi:hypothetical protein